jgi:hypothetical protein
MKNKKQILKEIKQDYINNMEKTISDNLRLNDPYPLYFWVEQNKIDYEIRKQVIKEIKAAGYKCEIEDKGKDYIKYKIEY